MHVLYEHAMAGVTDAWSGAVLGLIQGLTEFLPVSSSGHVAAGALLFNQPAAPLSLVVALHVGTLLATFVVLGPEILQLTRRAIQGFRSPQSYLTTEEGRTVIGVLIGTLPTALFGRCLEEQAEQAGSVHSLLGLGFLASAAWVLTTRNKRGGERTLSFLGYFLVGIVQGIAVLPGVSRSGSTIGAAMILGMTPEHAFRFSFLLSLPAVTGAALLKLTDPGALVGLGVGGFVGALVAFVSGYGALLTVRHLLIHDKLWMCALYLVPLGIV
ncbi:MAG: undecaprenyl-diphosphate phosphatase, partial [Myxococcota bacterium]